MIKNPDNFENKLYTPKLKPEVLDHINNLKNTLELLANQVEELKKEKLSNDRLKKEIALKQEMEIILKAILESKEKNQEVEALSEEEKEEKEKEWEEYNPQLPEGMRQAKLPENYANIEAQETLEGHQDWIRTLQVLADGKIVSGSDDNTIKIWDLPDDMK